MGSIRQMGAGFDVRRDIASKTNRPLSKDSKERPKETSSATSGFFMAHCLHSATEPKSQKISVENVSKSTLEEGDSSCDQRVNSTYPQLDFLPQIQPNLHPIPSSSDKGISASGSLGSVQVEEMSSASRDLGSLLGMGLGFHQGVDVRKKTRASSSSRITSEDDNDTRKRLRLSKEQSAFLEQTFKEHNILNLKQKLGLAERLNLEPRQIEVWFQNRRARTKLKQTEAELECLKRSYQNLIQGNRNLQKELKELRALYSSNPSSSYMT